MLFVHPNFPGQFRRIAEALSRLPNVNVVGVGDKSWMNPEGALDSVPVIAYPPIEPEDLTVHPWAKSFDASIRRGEQVLRALSIHKERGLEPDVIVVHPGWGDAFFLRDYFPGAKVIGLFEYYYHVRGADVGFDPDFPSRFDDIFRIRALNATQLLALDSCDEGFCPTRWQRSRFPSIWQDQLSLIHDGIDTTLVSPRDSACIKLSDGTVLTAGDEVLTFVSRNLEPYRGYHVFMRALPAIMKARPNCQVVIVGGDSASYSPPLSEGKSYLQRYLSEVEGQLDMTRVHFTGTLSFYDYLRVLQVSRLHVYLTYPFILSWSMLEAMSAGCLVLASATAPVEEVIQDGVNGMLFPFQSPQILAAKAIHALANTDDYSELRASARQTILTKYDFASVTLPAYRRLLEI